MYTALSCILPCHVHCLVMYTALSCTLPCHVYCLYTQYCVYNDMACTCILHVYCLYTALPSTLPRMLVNTYIITGSMIADNSFVWVCLDCERPSNLQLIRPAAASTAAVAAQLLTETEAPALSTSSPLSQLWRWSSALLLPSVPPLASRCCLQ